MSNGTLEAVLASREARTSSPSAAAASREMRSATPPAPNWRYPANLQTCSGGPDALGGARKLPAGYCGAATLKPLQQAIAGRQLPPGRQSASWEARKSILTDWRLLRNPRISRNRQNLQNRNSAAAELAIRSGPKILLKPVSRKTGPKYPCTRSDHACKSSFSLNRTSIDRPPHYLG